MEELRSEYLGKGIYVLVSRSHGFGTDAILLAHFANVKKNELICDLGTGCGIIPLLWCREERNQKITALDIQQQACFQLSESIKLNGLEDKIKVLNADLKQLKGVLPFEKYDLVTMNPPYKAPSAGIKSSSEADLTARHETACTLDDIIKAASQLLRFGGRLCLCQRPERLCDIFCTMRKYSIEPKRLRTVAQTCGKAPWLILVEGRKGGKSGTVIEPDFFIMDGDDYSDELKLIYKDYFKDKK
ncbi:MAG: methyltransferase [Clostridiales bacterium]|nr:methyltransferase [Clostridiales bacterium]